MAQLNISNIDIIWNLKLHIVVNGGRIIKKQINIIILINKHNKPAMF